MTSGLRCSALRRTHNHSLECDTTIDFELATDDAAQGGSRFIGSYLRQKTKAAEIYPQNRCLSFAHHARRAQQRAVTAQDNHQIGLAPELSGFRGPSADKRSRQRIAHRIEPTGLDPCCKLSGQRNGVLRPVSPYYQSDRPYGLG